MSTNDIRVYTKIETYVDCVSSVISGEPTAPPDSELPHPSRPAPPDSELPHPSRPAPPDSELPHPSRDSAETEERPTLPELLLLKISQKVGPNYKIFGTLLLNDTMGNRVESIKLASLGQPEDIVTKILQEWVVGRGVALNWDTLVKTLRDCELNTLADQIQATKVLQDRPPPSDSEPPQLSRDLAETEERLTLPKLLLKIPQQVRPNYIFLFFFFLFSISLAVLLHNYI